jgi:aryl-alcohol dehydrogenase
MEIRAAVARAPHTDFSIETATLEEPGPGEVLIAIAGVGVCHTDLVARDQFIPIPLPAVLGHEGSGTVLSVGAGVTKVAAGEPVVLSFTSCGHCRQCAANLPSYCREFPALNYSGARPDGTSGVRIDNRAVSANFFGQSSFATHALAHERNVVKVPDRAGLEILGPLGCGLQTGAGGVMRSLACPRGSSIAIFGGGPVGLAAVMGAVVQGCALIVLVEPIESRRRLALELGATHVIDPTRGDVAAAVRSIASEGVEFAFETSGKESVVETALSTLSSHGLLGLVGVPPTPQSSLTINLTALITFGHRIHGIIEGDSDLDRFIPELIALHRAGSFPFDKLIKTFPFEHINEAIEAQLRGECVKAVLVNSL